MIKEGSILSKYDYDINYSKKWEDNNMIKFSWRDKLLLQQS